MPSVRDAVPQIHLRLANPMKKVAFQYLLAFLGVLHLQLRSATLPVLGGQDKALVGMRVREMVIALKTSLYVSQAAHRGWVIS